MLHLFHLRCREVRLVHTDIPTRADLEPYPSTGGELADASRCARELTGLRELSAILRYPI